MKLEDQVVSLELAKKLKALNVKQESLWFWGRRGNAPARIYSEPMYETEPGEWHEYQDVCSAFTVAELGEMWIELEIDEPLPHIGVDGWYWYKGEREMKARTEADARGAMLVYLLENKLITL